MTFKTAIQSFHETMMIFSPIKPGLVAKGSAVQQIKIKITTKATTTIIIITLLLFIETVI